MGKRNIDYAFKSYVLNKHNDLIQKQKTSSLYDYATYQLNKNGVVMHVLTHSKGVLLSQIDLFYECFNNGLEKEYSECVKINKANYQRVKRLKERVKNMLLKGKCIFLTLTFNDLTLSNTTDKERRIAVVRYLKSFNTEYIANIDFGARNHREHYHALILADKVNYALWNKYGAINGEKVRNKDIESDKTKLAKYIAKLSNHAIKETTKRSALIYSR